jgi:hypothetical protein
MANPEPKPQQMAERLDEIEDEIEEARKKAERLEPERDKLPGGQTPPVGPA